MSQDILEEAKKFYKGVNHLTLSSHGDSHTALNIMRGLASEVERLRSVSYQDSFNKGIDLKLKMAEQIDTLTKQLEEANHIIMDIPANSNPDVMIRELTKERDELKERITAGWRGEVYEHIKKLEAERDEWKGEVERLCDRGGLIRSIERLEAENAELKAEEEVYEINAGLATRQIKKLEAENAELREKVVRLADRISRGFNDDD